MAGTRRPSNNKYYSRTQKRIHPVYEDGSAARKLERYPDEESPRRRRQRKQESRQLRENRARAHSVGPGYVLFLTAVCIATLLLCVYYLQLRSTVTTQLEKIAEQESDLSTLKAENDAYYNLAINSVTLDEVREAALNRLGLHYANESQIQYYDPDDSGYVRQYQDLPDD